ncbi:hypothetical protein [Pseudolactococcus carnosus]|uniref:Zona occludens toxin N-terminal domain-containing protein n=1 Tax=Pseudolactococcus carnosus TaxID=2749961 RepID=A0ABT0AW46_9LACT|nr:hypothetical protein [Lactococcus carnosus]MCJ1990831.1 hypothetical protein [Lactococcus carnosus]
MIFQKDNKRVLSEQKFLIKLARFFGYVPIDIAHSFSNTEFNDFGIDIYCGRQGSGKTVSMVDKLDYYRRYYPKCQIFTNFGYKHETGQLIDWQQLLNITNGVDGVVFAIDEIHNEFDLYDAKGFNTDLLRLISMQRKQHIKILGTAQVYSDVNIKLRRQTFKVIDCYTIFRRWTFQKAFDALEYNRVVDNPEKKAKLKRLWRKNLVQNARFRDSFDSSLVIDNMKALKKRQNY